MMCFAVVTDGEDIPNARRVVLVVTDGEERNADAILASIIVAKNNLILIEEVCAQVLSQIYLTVDQNILLILKSIGCILNILSSRPI